MQRKTPFSANELLGKWLENFTPDDGKVLFQAFGSYVSRYYLIVLRELTKTWTTGRSYATGLQESKGIMFQNPGRRLKQSASKNPSRENFAELDRLCCSIWQAKTRSDHTKTRKRTLGILHRIQNVLCWTERRERLCQCLIIYRRWQDKALQYSIRHWLRRGIVAREKNIENTIQRLHLERLAFSCN